MPRGIKQGGEGVHEWEVMLCVRVGWSVYHGASRANATSFNDMVSDDREGSETGTMVSRIMSWAPPPR